MQQQHQLFQARFHLFCDQVTIELESHSQLTMEVSVVISQHFTSAVAWIGSLHINWSTQLSLLLFYAATGADLPLTTFYWNDRGEALNLWRGQNLEFMTETEPDIRDGGGAWISWLRWSLELVTEVEPAICEGDGACNLWRRQSLDFVTEAEPGFCDRGGALNVWRRRSLKFVTETEPWICDGGGAWNLWRRQSLESVTGAEPAICDGGGAWILWRRRWFMWTVGAGMWQDFYFLKPDIPTSTLY